MHVVANLSALESDGIINTDVSRIMRQRSRETMVMLGINVILCGGILAATAGLIFWLASALSVAITGIVFLIAGLFVLLNGKDTYRMFGNAASLIGAGMLVGGAGLELVDKYPDQASLIMIGLGALVALGFGYLSRRHASKIGFVAGAAFLMGIALHLAGLYFALEHYGVNGIAVSLSHLYAAVLIAFAGWFVDVRLVTALAIVPFAQVLDTSTSYFHAAYVFYSPESTLSILQMIPVVLGGYLLAYGMSDRSARHSRILATMAFIVANLCALVGSLWGDVVGSHIWGPLRREFDDWQEWRDASDAFKEMAFTISSDMYSIVWAVALMALVFVAAHRNNRALFNTALTFGGIHAYTQLFESFADEPLAWVIGGLAAIPLAWGLWRANQWFTSKDALVAQGNSG
ncbi:MAG: hypothetical protein AAGF25_08620 [Pseudomonadota bacterium]